MAALTPDTLARVARLVPLLSSDKAGETAATAAAIGRTLHASGADFHDLAAALAGGPAPRATRSPQPLTVPTVGLLSHSRLIASMQAIAARPWATEWEAEFCLSIADQACRQPHRRLTPKQVKACDGLLRRAYAEGLRP